MELLYILYNKLYLHTYIYSLTTKSLFMKTENAENDKSPEGFSTRLHDFFPSPSRFNTFAFAIED